MGDFRYNGIPVFDVGFMDFATFSAYLLGKCRLLSRNIEREDLREFYSRKGTKFGIRYAGIILDISASTDRNI